MHTHTSHIYTLFFIYVLTVIKSNGNLKRPKRARILHFQGGSETHNNPEWSLLIYFHKGKGNYTYYNLHSLADRVTENIKINENVFGYKFKNDRPWFCYTEYIFKVIPYFKEK